MAQINNYIFLSRQWILYEGHVTMDGWIMENTMTHKNNELFLKKKDDEFISSDCNRLQKL